MHTLIIYDSIYGNTAQVAQAMAGALAGEVTVRQASSPDGGAELRGVGLLIVGSPTYGGRPTEAMQAWLEQLPPGAVQGIRVAAFDTRLTSKLVRIFGYAAPKIAEALQHKGGTLLAPPAAFMVKGRKGPLVAGELERADTWARELAASIE